MTQYQQMKALVKWVAESYGFLVTPDTLEPTDITEFFRVGDYGYNKSEEEYKELQEEYDFKALEEFWDEGKGWTFSNLAGLFN